MIKQIPNIITLLNLLSGSVAILFAIQGNIAVTYSLIIASLIFDFCDGLAARLLKAYSEIGKELDSLADLVSFGVAPAFLVRSALQTIIPDTGFQWLNIILVNLPLLLIAATAYRLARFNVDTEQTEVFKGLPAPAGALFWVSFVYFVAHINMPVGYQIWIFETGVLLISYQLMSKVPMFSLKFKHLKWAGNEVRFSFLILSILLFIFLKLSGFFVVIWLYILFSLFQKSLSKN